MARHKTNNVIMKSDYGLATRIFGIVVGVIAFVGLYLTIASSVVVGAAGYAAVLLGAAAIAVCLVFTRKKYVVWTVLGIAIVYTVLCITADFATFADSFRMFVNGIVGKMNSTMHRGYETLEVQRAGIVEFLFTSVLSVWLALGVWLLLKKLFVFVLCSFLITLSLIIAGLYPSVFAVMLLIIAWLGLLAVLRGLNFEAAAICLAGCVAVVAIILPCIFYNGSEFISSIRNGIADSVEDMLYGDDSLPEGELSKSGSIHATDTLRLSVTIPAQTPELYLKGFVGSDLKDNKWQETDKNKYVQNGYQGMLSYVRGDNIPLMQYARYSTLSGTTDRYSMTVKNIAADSKYVYLPYTATTSSVGKAYYDLNLRDGVNSADKYEFSIFGSNLYSERVTQADWVIDPDLPRTQAMIDYLRHEGVYRAFVYDTYCAVDKTTAAVALEKLGETTKSINTATQLIRAYLLANFEVADGVDGIKKDFLTEFFDGSIEHANAPYFATAAVYMYRALGFAARYAEGYFVNAAIDTEDQESYDEYTVTLTDADAHAWVEVYFDGIGWLPIEVTPGYFSEKMPDTTVEPEHPDKPDDEFTPQEPEPIEPEQPDKPIIDPNEEYEPTVTKGESGLYKALKILLPIALVLLAFAIIVVLAVARWRYVLYKKHKSLKASGSAFGRSAYSIVEHDVGACDVATLKALGVSERKTERFIAIIEKSVYGEHELSVNENNFVMRFIHDVAERVCARGTKLNGLYCKYIRCVGI